MKKPILISLIFLFCIILFIYMPQIVLGDENSSGTSGSDTDKSVVPSSADYAATEDDQKRPKGLDNGFSEVDASGAFQYQYPINIPPGTHGINPVLKLFYNSNCSNGMLGMGWTLVGISKIERDYSYPVHYNNTDHFMYDGKKLVMGTDGFYHIAKESFERIEFIQSSGSSCWVITQNNGTKLYFGYQATEHMPTTCGRIEGIGTSGYDKTIVWSLSKVVDLQGNYYVVEYYIDGTTGAYYPVKITYTKNENYQLLSNRTVEFSYETRTDHGVMYNPTYTDMQRRLKWIIIKMGGNLLRKYRLDYEYSNSTGRSSVIKLQEYGNDGNNPSWPWVDGGYIATGKILSVIKLDWSQKSHDTSVSFINASNFNITNMNLFHTLQNQFSYIGDFNGDGKADILHGSDDPSQNCLYISNGDGSFTKSLNFNITNAYLGHSNGTQFSFIANFNGDGKVDILHGGNDPSYNCLYLSNGDGSFTKSTNFK